MRRITVHKASPLSAKCIEPASIDIHEPLYPTNDLNTNRLLFQEDAEKIVSVLIGHLPGGTIDRVLIELLKRRASGLHVAYKVKP